MKIIYEESRLCTCCMEMHDVKTVCVEEHESYKDVSLCYNATYYYCDKTDELYMDENQLRNNSIALKDAYRKEKGLLTSKDIIAIRTKYGISQSDFCTLLGWGGKTITRYESSQVQDKAHDTILKKINQDPVWFLELLDDARQQLSMDLYKKYYKAAVTLYESSQETYLREAIKAKYVGIQNKHMQGDTDLSLDKVVDMIRYFAMSSHVTQLYKVKLMKLMWYADALSYKERGYSITGLAYQAMPMGAVPIGHELITNLQGVPCKEEDIGETTAYHFVCTEKFECPTLSEEEKNILDSIIHKLGHLSKQEIVNFMHEERAYKETRYKAVISFEYAKDLQI